MVCAPAAGAKKQKKKWSKGKVKDKAQHAVLLDKTTSEKLYKDVQSYRLVTVAVLVDRMKINGSLARQCIADLEEKGMIKPVVSHSKMKIYSMTPAPLAVPKLLERRRWKLEIWRLTGLDEQSAIGSEDVHGTKCPDGTHFMLGVAYIGTGVVLQHSATESKDLQTPCGLGITVTAEFIRTLGSRAWLTEASLCKT
ncbi:s25 ribosomal protein domain-containing protein [Purpureocillium lilacinum]|uniref:S25 ribosomal protein domain-containing protein n=1 Tax=Purpureocillium lilacinum TaxID=33203 RepID=A0A179GR32_PURLI|nr:s25 ribosomal protein domain-containing protein [Purpureocillium lilacinum]